MPLSAGMSAVAALATVAVYYLATLMIWIGHYLPHLPGSRLRPFHMGGHHAHYPDSAHARSARFHYGRGRHDSLVPQLPWLFGLGFVLWLLLPAGWGIAAAAEVALVAAAHSYVHMHFHLEHSWLARFDWFRRARATHDLHHDRDVNFMVADHFWDRLCGTYQPPR
jgi:sterol desaturase/sphingolipid hydroxylase (fatty acid hydroxylase superfamily)